DHYRPVMELGAARIARSPEALAAHISAYLADPSLDRAGRRRLVELQVMSPLAGASERILGVLEQIAAGVETVQPFTERRRVEVEPEQSAGEALRKQVVATQLPVARLREVR